MSKILDASCDATGKVSIEGVVITDAVVLSKGQQASTGVALIEGDQTRYLPSSATDIESTINKAIDTITSLAAALTQVATTLTSIGAGMTGPTTAPPPTLATDVLAITAKVTELNATKAQLTTLKGALK